MSNPLNQVEHYCYLASHHRRLASNETSTEARNYHLDMAKNFSTLAAAAGTEEPINGD
jgi:Na+/phosphate symporter